MDNPCKACCRQGVSFLLLNHHVGSTRTLALERAGVSRSAKVVVHKALVGSRDRRNRHAIRKLAGVGYEQLVPRSVAA
jgi:hypothetical protein